MYNNLSLPLLLLGAIIPLAVAVLVLMVIGRAYRDAGIDRARTRRVLLGIGSGMAAWLAIIAALAVGGFFERFDTLPPRLALAFAPGMIATVLLVRSDIIGRVAAHIPQSWAVGFQGFRIAMEALLYIGLLEGVVPRQMTFEGLNFDIVTGVLAPIVAYGCFVRRSWSPRVAVAFNVLGLVLLAVVLTIANLSAPTAFRVFMDEPSTRIIAQFPFTWTPAMVIPGALFLHLVSLRGLRAVRRAERERPAAVASWARAVELV